METPSWLKWTIGIIFFLIMSAGVVWLSGFLFVLFSKSNPIGTTDFNTWFEYLVAYRDNEVVFKRLVMSAVVAAAISYGIPLLAIYGASRDNRALHGDARFANNSEISKAGLFCDDGIIVGKYKGKFLIYSGQQFVLLAAPTRGGKGVGMVIPNLLNYRDSAVVLDLKIENYGMTAGYREKYGQKVFLFSPFTEEYKTARYNPLGYVRDDDFRISDLTSIGEVFYPSGLSGNDGYFNDQARNLFVGLGLYLCETPTLPRTIGELLRQSSGNGQPIKQYLTSIIEERNFTEKEETDPKTGEKKRVLIPRTHDDGIGLPPLSSECVESLGRFYNTSDNTRSSILSTFNAPLGIWINPIVDAATSANDFDLRQVRKERMTIYIGIKPDQLASAGRLINLLFSQLINLNTKTLPEHDPELKYQCMLMMDEFTALGRVGVIAKSNSFIAGFNLRLVTIIQSTAQLESSPPSGYGREDTKTLVTNHAMQILFPPREQSDAESYSKMLGDGTVKGRSHSKQMGRHATESFSDQRRALLLPQEMKEIGKDNQIIILEDCKPIFCKKVRYFSDHVFIDRLKEISPSLAKIKGFPTKEQLDYASFTGELSPEPPLLDLNIHKAKLQNKIRNAEPEDVQGGINLEVLAVNVDAIADIDNQKEELEPEEVEDFVSSFFDSLDEASINDYSEEVDAEIEAEIATEEEIDIFEVVTESAAAETNAVTNETDYEDQNEIVGLDDEFDLSVLDK